MWQSVVILPLYSTYIFQNQKVKCLYVFNICLNLIDATEYKNSSTWMIFHNFYYK
jgi:hypothetical protein